MPHAEPLVDVAIKKAKKGHRPSLIWRDNGDTKIAPATADAFKSAMLLTGTQKSFTLIAENSGHFYRITWTLAVCYWRNARRYGFN
jgi:hypothetical protein